MHLDGLAQLEHHDAEAVAAGVRVALQQALGDQRRQQPVHAATCPAPAAAPARRRRWTPPATGTPSAAARRCARSTARRHSPPSEIPDGRRRHGSLGTIRGSRRGVRNGRLARDDPGGRTEHGTSRCGSGSGSSPGGRRATPGAPCAPRRGPGSPPRRAPRPPASRGAIARASSACARGRPACAAPTSSSTSASRPRHARADRLEVARRRGVPRREPGPDVPGVVRGQPRARLGDDVVDARS